MKNEATIYGFMPSEAASIVATVLFGLSTIFHCYQTWKCRAFFFIVFIIGATMMTIGYIARCISAESPDVLLPYIVQYICILLPPSLYAASIYMIYGRIVILVNKAELSLIAPHKVTKVFVLGDALAFMTQLGGGSLMTSSSTKNTGATILLAGLIIQLISFGIFLATSITFESRLRRSMLFRRRTSWRTLLYVLFFAAALIIIRCIYRIIEAAQGSDGYLATHEAYIYVFDALPMFVVQFVFHFCPPGKISGLVGPSKSSYLDLDDLGK